MNSAPNLLEQTAQEYYEVDREIKELEARKKRLRDVIFEQADESYNDKDYLLPTTSVVVPKEFLEQAGLTAGDFLDTRFPAWNLMSTTEQGDSLVFVLRKKREYMPFVYEGVLNDDEVGYGITRTPSEATPSIDWDLLKKLRPEMFDALAEPVISYELREAKLNELHSIDPEGVISMLRLFTVHKKPTLRVLSKFKGKGNPVGR